MRYSDTPNPRSNIAEAFGYLSGPEVLSALKGLADDPDAVVGEEAVDSIRKIKNIE